MNLDTLNREDLYKEIADLAREQGAMSYEDWRELVSVVVDGHLDIGELDRDQDLVGLKTDLTAAWEEYKRESSPESESAVDEDPEAPKS